MRRHDTDYVSLVAGILFLAVAAAHVAARLADSDLSLHWLAPTVLLLLGGLGLAGVLRGSRPGRTPSSGEPADPAQVDAATPDEVAESR